MEFKITLMFMWSRIVIVIVKIIFKISMMGQDYFQSLHDEICRLIEKRIEKRKDNNGY